MLVRTSDGLVDVSKAIEVWPKKDRWWHSERMYKMPSGYFRYVKSESCLGGRSCWFEGWRAARWFFDKALPIPTDLKRCIKC